jgi:hypothetical protein
MALQLDHLRQHGDDAGQQVDAAIVTMLLDGSDSSALHRRAARDRVVLGDVGA